jgi:hypothetical protein
MESYFNQSLNNKFSSYSFATRLSLYEGPQNIETLISDFIKQREEQAKKEGIRETIEKIMSLARKQIDDYVLLITKIVDIVYEEVKRQPSEFNFNTIKVQTNFYFDTHKISILFIIDTNPENELKFANLLHEIEKIVFQKDHFVAELLYVNQNDSNIDYESITQDYPYHRKFKDVV